MVIPIEEYEQIFMHSRERMQDIIDHYRRGIWASDSFDNPEYCDYLRECGYQVPDDWPSLREKDES